MLSQQRADQLIDLPKGCVNLSPIQFPLPGQAIQLELKSLDDKESFLVDVNRKGRIKLSKCTYQERYEVVEILLRLDVGGPPHVNPDGEEVVAPHLHIYREGFGDKWARPAPPDFSSTDNLPRTLEHFLKYCKVPEVPSIQLGVQ
ncbi:MAG: hypothetical protein ABIK89_02265 [Planctomycetota bacterium]